MSNQVALVVGRWVEVSIHGTAGVVLDTSCSCGLLALVVSQGVALKGEDVCAEL